MMIRHLSKYSMLLVLIIFMLILSACYNEDGNITIQALTDLEEDLSTHNLSSYSKFDLTEIFTPSPHLGAVALLDDGVIFSEIHNSNNVTFYRYYFATEEFVEFASIEGVFMGMRQFEMVGNKIYFYLSVVDENDISGIQNILFEIDLINNELTQLSHDTENLPGVNTHWFDGKLVSLKFRLENDTAISFLEITDPDTGTSEIVLESRIGELYVLHTTDDSFLYVLHVDIYSDGDEFIATIKLYDKNFEHVRNIHINDVAWEVLRSRPSILRVFGDYIFMHNYSSRSFIGRIEEDGEVLQLHSGTLSMSQTRNLNLLSNIELFFENQSPPKAPSIALLDTDLGLLHEIAINVDDGYGLVNVMSNNYMVLITAMSPSPSSERKFFMTSIPQL